MKKLILFFTLIAFLSGCSNSVSDSVQANANTTFAVEGMMCEENCANYIERKIAKLEGVKSCEIDFEKNLATVIYNDEEVASTQFIDMVEQLNENKYKVSNVETEKINTSNSESSSNGGEETGNIMSSPSFEMPNIMEYLRNII